MALERRGVLLTFEGVEGSGKSTQAACLAEALRSRGLTVAHVREPGGTELAEAIRTLLLDHARAAPSALAEALLFQAARADLVERIVRPARTAGHVVIADRYADASVAYQGEARGVGRDIIRRLNELTVGSEWPDRTYILDVPVEVALNRVNARVHETVGGQGERGETSTSPLSRLDLEPVTFHQKVREAYRSIAVADPGRVLLLDGERPAGELAAEILRDACLLIEARGTI
jgi:dTMP kinase